MVGTVTSVPVVKGSCSPPGARREKRQEVRGVEREETGF